MHQSLDSIALNTIDTPQRTQTGNRPIEIDVGLNVDMQDFRSWWKAHVNETRYWGGGPDGVWAGAAR